ncbi:MAG: hypothetical protein WD200_04385 [Candidatus Andersenbacteria bacterium]
MKDYVFFLGSHPKLSALEAVAALKRANIATSTVTYTDRHLRITTADALPVNFLSRLGGTIRITEVLTVFSSTPAPEQILDSLNPLPPKLTLGFSTLLTSQNINLKKLGIEVKKAAKQRGTRVQFILPSGKQSQLNAAQVLFNALYKSPNAELTLLEDKGQILLLRTLAVQDIEKYELRDTQRPARDARVGMLPPKVAQMMINIALREVNAPQPAILDPFCGAGTILQEAWLMGFQSVGADASSNMVAASHENLTWLHSKFNVADDKQPELLEHDARQPYPEHWNETFDAVITEPFLGKPISTPLPSAADLEQWQAPLHELYTRALFILNAVVKPGGVILFLLPAAKVGTNSFTPLPEAIFDEIQKAGYSMVQLVPEVLEPFIAPTDRGTLMYSRPDALVAREFTLWKKNS